MPVRVGCRWCKLSAFQPRPVWCGPDPASLVLAPVCVPCLWRVLRLCSVCYLPCWKTAGRSVAFRGRWRRQTCLFPFESLVYQACRLVRRWLCGFTAGISGVLARPLCWRPGGWYGVNALPWGTAGRARVVLVRWDCVLVRW